MADLSGQQLKDSYQNLLTIDATIESNPTSGQLENGLGNAITALGIGTDSPVSIASGYTNLTINGTGASDRGGVLSLSKDNTEIGRLITFGASGSETLAIQNMQNESIVFRTTGSDDMTIDSSGNVLVGKTASSGVATGNIEVSNSSSASVQIEGGTHEWSMLVSASADALRFYQDSTERLRINSSGNVGIGCSPSDRLEVKGATAKGALVLSSGDTTIIGNDVIGQINFKDYDADAHAGGDQNDLVNIKAIALHESGGATALDGSSGEGYALSFSTSLRPSPNALFTVSEKMRIDSSGNVGIGSASPSSKLSLIASSVNGLHLGQQSDNTSNSSRIFFDNSTNIWTAYSTLGNFKIASGATIGSSSGADRLVIDTSGNVLVGKTSLSNGVAGIELNNTGQLVGVFASGTHILGRNTNDGSILTFEKDGTTVGQVGTIAGLLSIGSNNNVALTFTSSAIRPSNNDGSGRDNAIDLGQSGNRFNDLYLGGSVYLGGTTSANALDDYEEGTWTPVLRGSGTAGTYELSSSLAYYTKVGRLVTIHLSINLDDPITGGGSGYTQITGLPYAKIGSFHTTAVVNSIGFDYTGDYLITRFTTGGDTSTVLGIFGNVDNGSLSLTPISGLSAGDSFTITVSYLT
jgi:hypothetical protein